MDTIQGYNTFTDNDLNIEFQGVYDDILNNRYELVKMILNKLDNLPSGSPNSCEFENKKDVKNYLSDIPGIKFVYDDTGNFRLNLQKYYGKKSAKLKNAFDELKLVINMHYKEHIQTMYELEIDITNFVRDLDLEIVKYLFLAMKNKYRITAWFKQTWIYILKERKKYEEEYEQKFLSLF